MRDPSPRAPFDQGLFLTHYNKGKDFYDARRFEEAERELEEAYLLRPRDQKVLNLLGLVYFRQDKYDKAEEVYRKLVADSPEAHTLFYNLGLICFKLNRLEDAESAFLKALEISRDNAKINFYLGSIYERLHRFKDAIYQYRQAGANIMVRRVEDKIAAAVPAPAGPSSPPPPPPAAPPRPAEVPAPEATNQFSLGDLRPSPEISDAETLPGKKIGPVSDALMASGAPRVSDTDTARFRLDPNALQPPSRSDRTAPIPVTLPAAVARPSRAAPAPASAAEPPTAPPDGPASSGAPATPRPAPRGTECFRFLENNLMEIDFSGKVFIKQGTIYSYSGNLTFWVKEKRPGGKPALVIITGSGKLILTDRDREITFMQVEGETLYVEPSHLLACEETLTPRYVALGADAGDLEMLALDGRGMVALSVASKPLSLAVTPGLPVSVPSSSIITWSGPLLPQLVRDEQIIEAMLPGGQGRPLIRLEGSGRVLVEQATAGRAKEPTAERH